MLLTVTSIRYSKNSYLVCAAILGAFTLLAIGLDRLFLPKTGVLLVLELAVVMISIIAPRKMAIASGVICALVFHFFFTTPDYSLDITDAEDIINTIVFLIIAILTSQFADTYRNQSEALRQAEIRTNILLSVSHDLRTPLSGIIGALSTFLEYREKLSANESVELVNGALEESHRLHRYVENLLQATKLKNNEVKLTQHRCPIGKTLEYVSMRFDSPRIKLKKNNEDDEVFIQETLMAQAIYNLVDNALKYSPKECPVVMESDSDDQCVIVNIHDEGPGISDSQKPKVFDLFYSKRIGDQGEGGSGVGLTVAKGIIEAHGGTLTVMSPKKGCTMQIRLPHNKKVDG